MNYLLLTLGHGSSAIFVDNSKLNDKGEPFVIGYEQERLSGIKADSQFPIDAINEICKNVDERAIHGCTVLVSHWFDYCQSGIGSKYFPDRYADYLKNALLVSEIETVKPVNMTHHDAHAYSALAFYNYYKNERPIISPNQPLHIFVADGFGTNQEVFSIYRTTLDTKSRLECVHRVFGYKNSLGLMYQYATSYVGMKENQDEYKFLGYEPHIEDDCYKEILDLAEKHIEQLANKLIDIYKAEAKNSELNCEELINYASLAEAKDFWYSIFDEYLKNIGMYNKDHSSYAHRIVIAYLVQQVIETVMLAMAVEFGVMNLCVAGGCFYNVKLNNALLLHVGRQFDGIFCAMPLAGDQGAAIGMYEAISQLDEENLKPFPFRTLAIGPRNFYGVEKVIASSHNKAHITYIQDMNYDLVRKIAKDISDGHLVNIVMPYMEFGPRALCRTSTLFLPTKNNASMNNLMNGRNDVMPFAPIVRECNKGLLFNQTELSKVIGSDKFMICAHDYIRPFSTQYAGVMHKKTLEDCTYTGRPQIVSRGSFVDDIMYNVEQLSDAKCLVNTSFNVHGNPIVFGMKQIIDNFDYQCSMIKQKVADDESIMPKLYIINVLDIN